MKLPANLAEGIFVRRLNRFAALVKVGDSETLVHVANSGRMHELLVPGHRVYLAPHAAEHRKSSYDLCVVQVGETLVSADARLPPALVYEAFAAGKLPEFAAYSSARREVRFGRSRLDLLLQGTTGQCWVEVKSITLVVDGVGLFPDAPTERGRRHLEELAEAARQGCCAAVYFVIQRPDASVFRPNDATDPAFAQTLRRVVAQGVKVYARRCRVTRRSIALAEPVPVRL